MPAGPQSIFTLQLSEKGCFARQSTVENMSSLSQQAYSVIKEKIISCEYQPGANLNEAHLVATLGLTRMPLRDALRRLEFEGLLTIRAKKGITISNITADSMFHTYEAIIMLTTHVMRQYNHLLDRNKIRDLYERMTAAAWYDSIVSNVNPFCYELQEYIAEASANIVIRNYLNDLLIKKRRFFNGLDQDRMNNYFYNYFQAPHDNLDVAKALLDGRLEDAMSYIDATLREECHCLIMLWLNSNSRSFDVTAK